MVTRDKRGDVAMLQTKLFFFFLFFLRWLQPWLKGQIQSSVDTYSLEWLWKNNKCVAHEHSICRFTSLRIRLANRKTTDMSLVRAWSWKCITEGKQRYRNSLLLLIKAGSLVSPIIIGSDTLWICRCLNLGDFVSTDSLFRRWIYFFQLNLKDRYRGSWREIWTGKLKFGLISFKLDFLFVNAWF